MPTLKVPFPDARTGIRLPADGRIRLQVADPPVDVVLRLDLDPSDARTRDDRFTLRAKTGTYRQTKTVKDDLVAGDRHVDLRFTGLDREGVYTLDIDPGREGSPHAAFTDVPYAQLVELSRPGAQAAAQQAGTGDLKVRLEIDPSDAASRDDRFVLASTDGSWRQVKTVKDDLTPGDRFTDVLFTGLPLDREFDLELDLGREGGASKVFENVPYAELAGLCWQLPPQEAAATGRAAAARGDLKVRLDIDPAEAGCRDDRFVLTSADGSVRQTRTVRDDLRTGDQFVDLLFAALPPHLAYSLEVDDGAPGGRYLLFEDVPYEELAGLSWNVPQGALDEG